MTWPTSRPGYPRDERTTRLVAQVNAVLPQLFRSDGSIRIAEDVVAICLAELDAAVQAEREAIAKWHDGRATIYRVTAARLTGMNRDSFDGYARKEQDAADYIRSRGPTPALDAALAQARQETWEKAAVIAETLRDGNPSAIAGTAWWGTKIAAAIRLAAAQEGGKS